MLIIPPIKIIFVAPLVGAWIEIIGFMYLIQQDRVAPLVGAWIEIFCACCFNLRSNWSLLSWERGLKFIFLMNLLIRGMVAPLVGAWIEINVDFKSIPYEPRRSSRGSVDWNLESVNKRDFDRSLLSWERGLKYKRWSHQKRNTLSLLSWERGLKYHELAPCEPIEFCRSSRGSVDWNKHFPWVGAPDLCRSSRGSVDWNPTAFILSLCHMCRSSRGSVDWNDLTKVYQTLSTSRSSRGSVDWNIEKTINCFSCYVAPLVGAWIEIKNKWF